MREYSVTYYLGDMYHSYVVDADNEAEAVMKVLNRLPDVCKAIMHDFKIERYYQPW